MSTVRPDAVSDDVVDQDDIDLNGIDRDGSTPDEVQVGGGLTQEELAELKAVMHQHMAMLTSAGVTPVEALAIAAHVAALVYSKNLDDALAKAFSAVRV
jgi:non-ribosomal peptide synthetase component F